MENHELREQRPSRGWPTERWWWVQPGPIRGDLRAETAARGVKPVSNEHRRRRRQRTATTTGLHCRSGEDRGSNDTCADMMASGGPLLLCLGRGRHQKTQCADDCAAAPTPQNSTLLVQRLYGNEREARRGEKKQKETAEAWEKNGDGADGRLCPSDDVESVYQLRRSVPLLFQHLVRQGVGVADVAILAIVSVVLLAGSLPRTPTLTTSPQRSQK